MERPRAELLLAPATPAEEWPRLVATLWPRAPAAATCLIAPLEGQAALLGRFQCAPSALAGLPPSLPAARRATGGRTLSAGKGYWALALSLPHTGALLPDGRPVPPSKIVNRTVRPVLGALAALGAPAGYFGRDVITVATNPVAYVSFDALADGSALFEALISFEEPLFPGALPLSQIVGSITNRPGPESFIAALRRGFDERLGATLGAEQPALLPAAPSWPGAAEELPPRASRPHEIAIGFVEARVEIDELSSQRTGTRVLARARVLGDFQADAPSVARLEDSLSGCPVEEVPISVDAAFGPQGFGTIVGLKSLRPIADALLEAAGAQV